MYLGSNIRRLREKYKISQNELALETIDRTLLSKLENKKRILTDHILNIIINNFNHILNEKGINILISKEDFLSESVHYRKILEKNPKLNEILIIYKNLMDRKRELIDEDQLYIIYSIGNKLMQFKEYKKTYNLFIVYLRDFLRVMSISINEIVILNITRCIIFSGKYNYIYNVEHEIDSYIDNFSYEISIKVFFNTYICNKELKHYKKCYNYIHFLSERTKEMDFGIEVELASIFKNLKEYNEALDKYKKMLKIFKKPDEQVWININIAYLLFETSRLEKVNKNIIEIKRILETQETDIECLSQRYKILGEFYYKINKLKQAKEYYIRALKEYDKYKPRDPYPVLYYELMETLIKLLNKKDGLAFNLIENNFAYLHSIEPNARLLLKLLDIQKNNIYKFENTFFDL